MSSRYPRAVGSELTRRHFLAALSGLPLAMSLPASATTAQRPAPPLRGSGRSSHLLVGGTASSVGKNTVTTALIHIIRSAGISVAPLKALDIEFLPPSGLTEYSPAVSIQSIAAQVKPTPEMNPVRIVFTSAHNRNTCPRLILTGTEQQHPERLLKDPLAIASEVAKAITALKQRYEVLVMEGSGALADWIGSEIFRVVLEQMDPGIVVVSDARLGGAFPATVGNLELFSDDLRRRIIGVVVNRMPGTLEDEPVCSWNTFLRKRYGVPVVGVLPELFGLEGLCEDRVPLDNRQSIEADAAWLAGITRGSFDETFLRSICESRARKHEDV